MHQIARHIHYVTILYYEVTMERKILFDWNRTRFCGLFVYVRKRAMYQSNSDNEHGIRYFLDACVICMANFQTHISLWHIAQICGRSQ